MKYFFLFLLFTASLAYVFTYAQGTADLVIVNPRPSLGKISIEGTDQSCSYSDPSGKSTCVFPLPVNQGVTLVGAFSSPLPFSWKGCDGFTKEYKCVINALSSRREVTVVFDESLQSSQTGDKLPTIMVPAQHQEFSIYAGDGFVQQISAQDPEGQELAFTLQSGPSGFSVGQKTGLALWQSPSTSAGAKVSVTFSVSDRALGNTAGREVSRTFVISVLAKSAQQPASPPQPSATPNIPAQSPTQPPAPSPAPSPTTPTQPQSSITPSSGQKYFYFYDLWNKECRRTTATYAGSESCKGAVRTMWGEGNTGNNGQCFDTPYLCASAFGAEAAAGRIVCDSSKTTQSSVGILYWYQKGANVSLFRNGKLLSSSLQPGTDLRSFSDSGSDLQSGTSYTYALRNGMNPNASTMLDGITCATSAAPGASSVSPQPSQDSAALQPQKPYYFYTGGACRITNGTYASATVCKGALDQVWGVGNTGGQCFDTSIACKNAYAENTAAGSVACGKDSTSSFIKLYYWHLNGQNVSLFRDHQLIAQGLTGSGDVRDITDSGLQSSASYTYYLRNGSDSGSPLLDRTVCSTAVSVVSPGPTPAAPAVPQTSSSSVPNPAPSASAQPSVSPPAAPSQTAAVQQTYTLAIDEFPAAGGTITVYNNTTKQFYGPCVGTGCSYKDLPLHTEVILTLSSTLFQYASWAGEQCNGAICKVVMNDNKKIQVNFRSFGDPAQIIERILSVETIGPGKVAGQKISCPSLCTQSFPSGDYVLLSANPDPNSVFVGWSGQCRFTDGKYCQVHMNEARFVKATFSASSIVSGQSSSSGLALSIEQTGNGKGTVTGTNIHCTDRKCPISLSQDIYILLSANPDPNSVFVGWSGQCRFTDGKYCQVYMDGEKSVKAEFQPSVSQNFSLMITRKGSGTITGTGVSCNSDSCLFSPRLYSYILLSANPDPNSVFVGWSGQCRFTDGKYCQVYMDGEKKIEAVFRNSSNSFLQYLMGFIPRAYATSVEHNLQVKKEGTGKGTIISSDNKIACDPDCTTQTALYGDQSYIILTIVPDANSLFTGWSGQCRFTDGKYCQVYMDSAKTVTADFMSDPAKIQFPLSINLDGIGVITSNPSGIDCGSVNPTGSVCRKDFSIGQTVTLTTSQRFGSSMVFSRWSGGCASVKDNVCTVRMDSAKAVGATFLYPPLQTAHPLSVFVEGNGIVRSSDKEIACDRSNTADRLMCARAYMYGTYMMLSAIPHSNSIFIEWSGDCRFTDGKYCQVYVDDVKNVVAKFQEKPQLFQLSVIPLGGGTVQGIVPGIDCGTDCAEQYLKKTEMTLAANPAKGSVFNGWGGACSGTGLCKVVMDSQKFVYAFFGTASPRLTVLKNGNGTVESSPAGIQCGAVCSAALPAGTLVSLKASPAVGYEFSGWGGYGGCVGKNPTCVLSFRMQKQVVANFKKSAF